MIDTILQYFEQLSQIPRESGNEAGVRERLSQRATNRDYNTMIDRIGNIIITVPATDGLEHLPTTIIQAHMDMVCVSAPGVQHDFANDPIQREIIEGWMRAQGTTLGADNGIGLCMALAVCDESHGPLELFFTVDEEVGLTGALHTQPELLTGTRLINLDTEDLGEITISSAGGARLDISLPVVRMESKYDQYQLSLKGLTGGHSGVDIHKGRGNAHLIMQEVLLGYDGECELISIDGGSADNAIPANCTAKVGLADHKKFVDYLHTQLTKIQLHENHAGITIECNKSHTNDPSIAYPKEYLHALATLPLGVKTMSEKIDGLVQTSLSRGIISTHDDHIAVSGALRSSVMSELDSLIQQCIDHIGSLGECTVRSKYPGRQQDPTSDFVQQTKDLYQKHYDGDMKILAVHAGLECGAIVGAFDRSIDAVSFGPTIMDPHSPDERCEVKSIEITYEVLKGLVR